MRLIVVIFEEGASKLERMQVLLGELSARGGVVLMLASPRSSHPFMGKGMTSLDDV